MTSTSPMTADVLAAIATGRLELIDLTAPLDETTPVIQLPEPLGNTPKFTPKDISNFDEKGPDCYWRSFEAGEHVGTHVDTPNHWISGRDGISVDQMDLRHLIAPAVVLDVTSEVDEDSNFLLTRTHVEEWLSQGNELPQDGWLLVRSGWSKHSADEDAFLGKNDGLPATPGIDADCALWLATEAGIIGIGVETVGTDSGQASALEPPFPVHYHMLGNEKYGVTQLKNLDLLPLTPFLIVIAPLLIVGGTGSPARVLAIVDRD